MIEADKGGSHARANSLRRRHCCPDCTRSTSAGAADDYPSRPVTLIAPWPAGGAVDTLCRILGAKLTERLGKQVIIENRPGAGSVLGVAATARAAPDGYTW